MENIYKIIVSNRYNLLLDEPEDIPKLCTQSINRKGSKERTHKGKHVSFAPEVYEEMNKTRKFREKPPYQCSNYNQHFFGDDAPAKGSGNYTFSGRGRGCGGRGHGRGAEVGESARVFSRGGCEGLGRYGAAGNSEKQPYYGDLWRQDQQQPVSSNSGAYSEPTRTLLTLDEYKALKDNREKPKYNLRLAGDGEDLSQWQNMHVLKNKLADVESKEEERYDPAHYLSRYPQHCGRQKHIHDINIQFKNAPRRGIRGRGRARGEEWAGSRGKGDGTRFESSELPSLA